MSSDWIIIVAILVLFAGVVLVFRTVALDTQPDDKSKTKPSKKAVTGS